MIYIMFQWTMTDTAFSLSWTMTCHSTCGRIPHKMIKNALFRRSPCSWPPIGFVLVYNEPWPTRHSPGGVIISLPWTLTCHSSSGRIPDNIIKICLTRADSVFLVYLVYIILHSHELWLNWQYFGRVMAYMVATSYEHAINSKHR